MYQTSHANPQFAEATRFWKDNYFVLRVQILSSDCGPGSGVHVTSSSFEGFGVGFILFFLQSLTNPNAAPIQTGFGWFDVWILG